MTDRFEVTRVIPAPAAEIFAVLCDPRGHVAIDASGSLMSAIDVEPVTGVGDRFDLRMDREAIGDLPMGRYEVTVVITAFEQDREIAWTVTGEPVDVPLNHFYGYTLRPVDEGTQVRSWYDWSGVPEIWHGREMFGGVIKFPVIQAATLRATLAVLERTVMNVHQDLHDDWVTGTAGGPDRLRRWGTG